MARPSEPCCGIERIDITAELDRRPTRAPDHAGESAALHGLAEAMATEPTGVLQRLVEAAAALTGAQGAAIGLRDPGEAAVSRWAAATGAFAPSPGEPVAFEADLGGAAARGAILLRDVTEAVPAFREAGPPIREALIVPVPAEDGVIGTLWAVRHTPELGFGREAARLLPCLARLAAAAHRMVRTEAALRASEERQAFLLKLNDLVGAIPEPDRVMEAVVRALGQTLQVSRVGFGRVQADDRTIARQVSYLDGVSAPAQLPDMAAFGLGLLARQRAGATVAIGDVAGQPGYDPAPWEAVGARALVAVPLVRAGRLVAVLYVTHHHPRAWSADEVALIEQVAARSWDALERARAEAVLRESEERFRSVAEQAEAGIVLIDAQDRVSFANDRYCGILGRDRADLIGRSMRDLTHPDDWLPNEALLQRTLADGTPFTIEKRYLRPDGSVVWVRNAVSALRDAQATIVGGCVISLDVTDRREAEEKLRASEARLRLALAASRLGVWTYEPETDAFGFDDRVAAITGLPAVGRLPAPAVWDAVHPDDRATFQGKLAEALDPQGSGWNEAEGRFVHADGSLRWTQARAQAVFQGEGPARRPARVMGTLLDITDGRQAEAALRESEERFRTLASLVPALLWRSDSRGLHSTSNQSWLDYTGQTLEQVQDGGWLEVIHPDDRAATHAAFRAGRAGQHTIEAQPRVRRRDGEYRWFLVRQVPITDGQGTVAAWVGAAVDIHDLHEMQQRQAVLVDELQHRTRNLLGVVRSIAQQTVRNADSLEAFRRQFNDRLSALSRVQGLLSRSERTPITIRALIQTELDALGAAALPDRVTLEGPPVGLREASVQTFALALHELATNARKYGAFAAEGGRLAVRWRTHRDEAGGPRLVLTWSETGIAGPRAGQGPVRTGYGRELIERALPYALQAVTRYELGETDLHCSIDLPLGEGARARSR